ncbi:MAG: HAD family hydrolase [Promethearchaeota archaeon]
MSSAENRIGFIFDLDGTLVNSTDISKTIESEIVKKFNIEISDEQRKELELLAESMFQETYSTRLAIKIMLTLLKKVGLKPFERVKAMIMAGKIYARERKKVCLYDGVENLFKFLDENSIPYVIVTSASDKDVIKDFRNHPDLYQKLKPKIISQDSVKNVKPHPEPLEKASKLLRLPPNRIVVVGDTKYDILFGKNNGALTIGVTTGIYTEERLRDFEPDFIINSVVEIPEIFDKIIEKISSNH